MAARIRRIDQNERTRNKIKAGLLAKKLADHALGIDEMSATQIKAAEILLKKTMPDLKQTEHVGDPENPIEHNHSINIEFV